MHFWFKALEEYKPLLHLHNFSYSFKNVVWSVTGNMANNSLVFMVNEGNIS
jgi:hypothetical protein